MGFLGNRIGSTPGSGKAGGIFTKDDQYWFANREEWTSQKPQPIPGGIEASGGAISEYTDPTGKVFKCHTYVSSGTFAVTKAPATYGQTVEYCVIAGGGGGGGGYYGGGGGAGGVRINQSGHPLSPGNPPFPVADSTTYTVTVGGGGAQSDAGNPGGTGGDSYFGPPSAPAGITAKGGGPGMGRNTSVSGATDAYPGGSGGGGGYRTPNVGYGYNPQTPSPIVPNIPASHPYGITQGNNGGFCDGNNEYGSGGGGAGSVGADGGGDTAHGGDGGAGVPIEMAGNPGSSGVGGPGPGSTWNWFAGGGAGGGGGNSAVGRKGGGAGPTGANTGNGPYAGGGNSSINPPDGSQDKTSGQPGTGGGGGAGGGPDDAGMQGGAGIVMVRYQIASATSNAKATGGIVSFYGSKTIHTFFGSGTMVFPGSFSENCEYVIIAGGGGGGRGTGLGGGGGAGGYFTNTALLTGPQTAPITVGAGGGYRTPEAPAYGSGRNGSNSLFDHPQTPQKLQNGGGGGGSAVPSAPGHGLSSPGTGSGGGGMTRANDVGNAGGSSPPGNPGAAGTPGPTGDAAGGGGGAGGAATSPGSPGGNFSRGGLAIQLPTTFRDPDSSIGYPGPGSGEAGKYWVAGGGGGAIGGPVNPQADAGLGGGAGGPNGGAGDGGRNPTPNTGESAMVNSGSGGGGGYVYNGGNGGSGLVLVAYPT